MVANSIKQVGLLHLLDLRQDDPQSKFYLRMYSNTRGKHSFFYLIAVQPRSIPKMGQCNRKAIEPHRRFAWSPTRVTTNVQPYRTVDQDTYRAAAPNHFFQALPPEIRCISHDLVISKNSASDLRARNDQPSYIHFTPPKTSRLMGIARL